MFRQWQPLVIAMTMLIASSLACLSSSRSQPDTDTSGLSTEEVSEPTGPLVRQEEPTSQPIVAKTASSNPTITPTPLVVPDLAPVGYAYTLESGDDGWAYGQVKLGFQNITDHLVYNIDLPIGAAYVETEEDQTYPAVVISDECPPRDYEYSVDNLKLKNFQGLPPSFIARRAWPIGSSLTERFYICFRVAEITHPTRVVFSSSPEWSINLTDAIIADLGFPGLSAIQQAVPISSFAGHIFDKISEQASMFLDGTCSILGPDSWGYDVRLDYTIENKDNLQGAHFSGDLGSVAIESEDGTFMISHALTYDVEVGPGQTVHEYFEIDTLSSSQPVLLVLYSKLSNESRGYSIVSCDKSE